MDIKNLLSKPEVVKEAAPQGAIRPPSPGARDAVTQDLAPLINVGPQDAAFAGKVRNVLVELQRAYQQKTQLYDRLVLHKPTEQSDQFFFEDIKSVFVDWVQAKRSESETSVAAQIAKILTSTPDATKLQQALAILFQALGSPAQVQDQAVYRVAGGNVCAVHRHLDSFFLYQDEESGSWGDLDGNSRVAAEKLEEFLRL